MKSNILNHSINYIIKEIEKIEVMGHKRYVSITELKHDSLVLVLDDEITTEVDKGRFYRKWNFHLFELLKEMLDTGESSVYEIEHNSKINFKNSICDSIRYGVFSLSINNFNSENWDKYYLSLEREKKLKKIGIL